MEYAGDSTLYLGIMVYILGLYTGGLYLSGVCRRLYSVSRYYGVYFRAVHRWTLPVWSMPETLLCI